jgi:hypothetical protein
MECVAHVIQAERNSRHVCASAGIRICSGNTIIKLHGLNWFGFETGATFVDGLWQGPTSLTLDFMTNVRRIKLLGFNTIRLPMSLKVQAADGTTTQLASCATPGLVHACCMSGCAWMAACASIATWSVRATASSGLLLQAMWRGLLTTCATCLQSLFEDRPRDYRTNCPQSGKNAAAAAIWGNVRKPGLKSAPFALRCGS